MTIAATCGASARNAWPRWLIASFSPDGSSALVTGLAVRDEDRVVAEAVACRAARGSAGRASVPSTTSSRPSGSDQRGRAHERGAAALVGMSASWPSTQLEVGRVVAVPAGPARREHAGHAVQRVDASGPSRRRPSAGRCARTPSRALISALSANVAPVSGTSS